MRCILFLFLTFITIQLTLAQGFGDYKWKSDMLPSPIVPEAFNDADAIIYSYETYSRGSFSGTFPYIEQLASYREQYHVKILKEKGLKDYNRIVLNRFKGRIADYVQIKTVDIRIRKASGEIKDYNVRDLPTPEITEEDDYFDSKDDLFIYDIPDLAVGDELELVTVIESKFLDNGRIVNLYKSYPILNASFTISVPLKVQLKGDIYNGMPVPKVSNNSTNRIYKWEMTNLKAVPEANSQGTIFSKDLEYFIYELNFDAFRQDQLLSKVVNYADQIFQYAEDFLKVRVRKKKKLTEFYDNLFAEGAKSFGKTPEALLPVERVYLFSNFIMTKMKMVSKELEDYEKSEGIEYFLTAEKTDSRNLMRIYRDFFERFEIPYYLAIGKNRFSGPIDLNFVSNTQIGDYFFVFKNGDGFMSLSRMGGLNELPWNYYNTKCYMRDITDRQAKLQEINFGDQVLKDAKNNKRFSRTQAIVSFKSNQVTQKVSNSYSGLNARNSRGQILSAHKADTLVKALQRNFDRNYNAQASVTTTVKSAKVLKLDSSPLNHYGFKYKYEVNVDNLISEEEGVYQVGIDEFFSHNIRYVTNAKNRFLDYHVPFLGTDKEEVIFIFEKETTLTNAAELNQKLDNDYASYEFKVTQLKPNMIRIQSSYQLKQLFISKDKVQELDKVNQIFIDLRDQKFLFKEKS